MRQRGRSNIEYAISKTPAQVVPPVPTLTCTANETATKSCAEADQVGTFQLMLVNYGAEYVAYRSEGSFQNLANNLKSWALGNSVLTYPNPPDGDNEFRIKYTLLQMTMPLMQDWAAMQSDPNMTAEIRSPVSSWLNKLIPFLVAPYGGTGNPNNSGYLQMANRMAWGISKGDNSMFQDGIEQYWTALHQIRPDGVFLWKQRKCALNYQSQAIAPLIDIDEMAAIQGYDLYSFTVDGRTIHDAVRFLLDAADDTTLLDGYFQNGPCVLATPDLPYVQDSLRNSHFSNGYPTAWLETYIARFPNSDNSARLAKLPNGGLAASRPIVFDHSGGSTTCLQASPSSLK